MITDVLEMPNDTYSIDDDWVRTATRTFYVMSNNTEDGPNTARKAIPVQKGDGYKVGTSDGDQGCIAINVTSKRINQTGQSTKGGLFEVTLNYSSKSQSPEEQEQEENQNPLLMPVVISGGFEDVQTASTVDLNGKAIKNSAGDYFSPSPIIEKSRYVKRYSWNAANFSPSIAANFHNTVNRTSFDGFRSGKLRLKITGHTEAIENGIYHNKMTAEYAYDPEGWQIHILDRGLNERNGGGELVPIKKKKAGQIYVSEPVLLKDGRELQIGDPEEYLDFVSHELSIFEEFLPS